MKRKNVPILVPQCGPIRAPLPPLFGNENYTWTAMRSHFGPAMRSHFGPAKRTDWVRFWVRCGNVFWGRFRSVWGFVFGPEFLSFKPSLDQAFARWQWCNYLTSNVKSIIRAKSLGHVLFGERLEGPWVAPRPDRQWYWSCF